MYVSMLGQVKVHLECILHLEQTWWHHVGMATECTYSLAKTIVLEQAFPLQSWVRVLLGGQRSRVIQLHSYRGNMILLLYACIWFPNSLKFWETAQKHQYKWPFKLENSFEFVR